MNSGRLLGFFARVLVFVSLLSLAACGGGGGDGGNTIASGGVIGGTGFKGPVSGATIVAFMVNSGIAGAQIGTATTDANGNFSLPTGSYSGPVMIQLSGGSYTDEASGTMMNMASGDVMTALLPTVGANSIVSGIQVTPLTSMAQTMAQRLNGGMTDSNIAAANAAIGSYFMVSDILRMQPMNPLIAGSGTSSTQDSMNYGMALAAMSQYARSVGMSYSSAMVTAMMNDASDGVMDGRISNSPVMMGGMGMATAMSASAGTSGLASAMTAFVSSGQNRSGITLSMMQSLIARLGASNGRFM